MNWIRQERRLAIYLRDGLACVWCGQAIEDGTRLTLDHLTPHSRGGSNAATNLVTASHRCNSSRGARTVKVFAAAVSVYLDHGVTALAILAHLTVSRHRAIDVSAAKTIIARRGSFVAACQKRGKS